MGVPTDETEARARIAELQFQLHLNAHGEVGDILKTAFNWLYPTLVTLNSGALFLLASNFEKIEHRFVGIAGLLFCTGIFFALLVAYRVIRRSAKGRKLLAPLIEQASLQIVGIEGELEADSLHAQAEALNRGEIVSAIVGWSSFGCFVLGLAAIWFGVGLEKQDAQGAIENAPSELVAPQPSQPATKAEKLLRADR